MRNTKRHFNVRTDSGIITLETIDIGDFENYVLFKTKVRDMISAYKQNGLDAYVSNRSSKEWGN